MFYGEINYGKNEITQIEFVPKRGTNDAAAWNERLRHENGRQSMDKPWKQRLLFYVL